MASKHLRGLSFQRDKQKPQTGGDKGKEAVHGKEQAGGFERAKDTIEDGQPAAHTRDTHGTSAHPKTGVHAVHIHHHDGGAAKTHTFHDDQDQPEEREHGSMAEAHQHAQEMLPDEDDSGQNDNDEGDQTAEPGSSAGSTFGNMAGM